MENEYVERELMLVKVRAVGRDRDELMRMVEIFRARVIDVTDKTFTIEITGNVDKSDAFLKAIDQVNHSRNRPHGRKRHRAR